MANPYSGKKSPIEYADDILSGDIPPIIKHRKSTELYMYNQEEGHYSIIEKDDLKQYIYNFFITKGIPKLWNPSIQNQILEAIRLAPKVTTVDKLDDYPSLINLKNGVVDLDEDKQPYTLHPHSPDYYFTATVDVPYDPTATQAPYFVSMLKSIFRYRAGTFQEGTPDYDQESINSIMRLGGYLLYPQNKVEKMFIFYGGGSNGKGMVMEHVYKKFFTKEHMTSLSLNQLSNEEGFARYGLIKSRINFATEQKGGLIESEELKKIISGESILVNGKNKEPMLIEPKCKILTSANRLPYFSDTTYGTDRRLHIIMFPNKFMPTEEYEKEANPEARGIYEQMNKDEAIKKLEKELPAILNMFLISLQDLRKHNWYFPTSQSSLAIKKEYKEESDPMGSWIRERYIPVKSEHPDYIVDCSDILFKYSAYHNANSLSNKGLNLTTRFVARKIKELYNITSFKHSYRDPQTSKTTSGTAFYLKTKINKEDEILIQTSDTKPVAGDIPPDTLGI